MAEQDLSDVGPPDGVWLAFVLDGHGGAREIDAETAKAWPPDRGELWVHLDPRAPETMVWLEERAGLHADEIAELLGPHRLPQVEALRDDIVTASVRGLPEETDDPVAAGADDSPTVRFVLQPGRLLSLASCTMRGVKEARRRFAAGNGATDLPMLLVMVTAALVQQLHDAAIDIEVPLTDLEYAIDTNEGSSRTDLEHLDRQILRLRRHLAPLRVLLGRATNRPDAWPIPGNKEHWHRLADTAANSDSLLQAAHDRTRALHDTLAERLNGRTNTILYVLTVLSAVMLPLSLITGILGMNVAIQGASFPGMESPTTLLLVCAAMIGIGIFEFWLIKRLRLL